MESPLTHTPEQQAENRKQSRERLRRAPNIRLHDGAHPTVEEILASEGARLGVRLEIKKNG